MPKCFVIMPYGSTETAKKEYSRIYKLLIRSAAEECGLECIRSDIEGRGGHIMSNVIEDLASDDIVIADISGLNWNVAYELGIRHVMRKNGTILICDDETELPFDVQSLNIFIYPKDWLDVMEEQCDKLQGVIRNRMDGVTQGDSPVHEKFSFLPERLIQFHTDSTDSEMRGARERIAMLERELSEVYQKIESMGLSLDGERSGEVDYSKQFLADLGNNIYNSDTAVAKLRELLDQGDKEGFLEFLSKVLTVGYLDEADCRSVYMLCKKLNTPAINRTFLEAATKFYPDNDELAGFLANEYSMNYHTGDKALQMVNGILGVVKKDGVFQLAKTTKTVSYNKLASFFDVYIHLKKHGDMLEIGKLLYAKYETNKKLREIILRNVITAALEVERFEEAAQYRDLLLSIAPSNDLSHYSSYRYERAVDNYAGAVAELENCILCDPRDVDYYFFMAGYICDFSYARDPDTLEIVQIPEIQEDEYAAPFIMKALTVSPSQDSVERAIAFLRRNGMLAYIETVINVFQSGSNDYIGAFPELNYAAVEYCTNRGEF